MASSVFVGILSAGALLFQTQELERELARARGLLDAGAIDEALGPLERALALQPGGPEVLWMLAVAHLELERPEIGLRYAETLLAKSPETARSHALVAAYRDALGEHEAAVRSYREALAREPDNPQIRHDLALLHIRLGEDELAIESLEWVLERFPGDPRSLVPLGVLYTRAGRSVEALDALRRAAAAAPDSYEAHHYLGALYSTLGRYELALRHLDRALSLQEEDAATLFEKGMVHARREEIGEALPYFERARAANPRDARSHYQLGEIHLYEGDVERAEAAFAEALELDPGFALALQKRGRLYLDAGRPAEAAASLARSVELDPDDAEAHHQLARALDALSRGDEARRHFERAVELAPFAPEPRLSYGNFLLRRGERERGREVLARFHDLKRVQDRLQELRAAVDFDPVEQSHKERLIGYLVAEGRAAEAVAESRRFLALASMEPAHYVLAATAYRAAGEEASVLDVLERGRRLVPDDPGIESAFAKALVRSGQIERARGVLEALGEPSADVSEAWAAVHHAEGDVEAADASFRRCVELDPANPARYAAYARWLAGVGRRERAAEELKRAVARLPDSDVLRDLLSEYARP